MFESTDYVGVYPIVECGTSVKYKHQERASNWRLTPIPGKPSAFSIQNRISGRFLKHTSSQLNGDYIVVTGETSCESHWILEPEDF